MQNVEKFKKAQRLVNKIAKIREELHDLGYNRSLKILPDFVESYARDRFDLELKNAKGYDGIGKSDGKRYQIKYTIKERKSDGKEKFTHALDNIKRDTFDFLVAVILDENYNIIEVFKIPHEKVCQDGWLLDQSFRIQKVYNQLKEFKVPVIE